MNPCKQLGGKRHGERKGSHLKNTMNGQGYEPKHSPLSIDELLLRPVFLICADEFPSEYICSTDNVYFTPHNL